MPLLYLPLFKPLLQLCQSTKLLPRLRETQCKSLFCLCCTLHTSNHCFNCASAANCSHDFRKHSAGLFSCLRSTVYTSCHCFTTCSCFTCVWASQLSPHVLQSGIFLGISVSPHCWVRWAVIHAHLLPSILVICIFYLVLSHLQMV